MKALRTLLTFTALFSASPLAAAYTVKAGDTLQSVAGRFKLEPVQLMQLNGLSTPTLQVGQKLEVGAEDSASAQATAAARPATSAAKSAVKQITSAQAPAAARPPVAAAPAPRSGGAFVRSAATRFLGIRYVLGGTSGAGLDCSGFTLRVFQQMGISLPRTAASQWRMGASVSRRDLRAGDLVFFNTTGRGASHVGIYIGDGLMANANSFHGRTIIEPLFGNVYWSSRYIGARRVLS